MVVGIFGDFDPLMLSVNAVDPMNSRANRMAAEIVHWAMDRAALGRRRGGEGRVGAAYCLAQLAARSEYGAMVGFLPLLWTSRPGLSRRGSLWTSADDQVRHGLSRFVRRPATPQCDACSEVIGTSTNGGTSWSAPTAIALPGDQFQPWGADDTAEACESVCSTEAVTRPTTSTTTGIDPGELLGELALAQPESKWR